MSTTDINCFNVLAKAKQMQNKAAAHAALAAITLAHANWRETVAQFNDLLENGSEELQRELTATEINLQCQIQLWKQFASGERQ